MTMGMEGMKWTNVLRMGLGMAAGAGSVSGENEGNVTELPPLQVVSGSAWVAETERGGQLGEYLEMEPRVDLQARGGAGYQADLHIRGGIFSGAGVAIGGMTLFDPQTGHYFAEIPLDPGHFGQLRLQTGLEHALASFNATAGSLNWEWGEIVPGTRVQLLGGSDGHIGAGAFIAVRQDDWAVEASLRHEQGDGSVEGGDFRWERVSLRLEREETARGTLRFFGGYVDKFYGWPGMYTGFASLRETEDYGVGLVGVQWESGPPAWGEHRVGAYWRGLEDDYEFNRSEPNALFEHRTAVWSLQGDGLLPMGEWDLRYDYTLLMDELVRSTSLVEGDFREREYAKGGALLQRDWALNGLVVEASAGAVLDTSSEEATVLLPQVGFSLSGTTHGAEWTLFAERAETSRVPGYTVLKSAPSGLFGGNADLGRATSESTEGGVRWLSGALTAELVVFRREDRDLVDWVFEADTPTARRAAPLDATVDGVETRLRWEADRWLLEAGYAWLDKAVVYVGSGGEASFYVLNYARHRATFALEGKATPNLTLRAEGRYREHPRNLLRRSGDDALMVDFAFRWTDVPAEGWNLQGTVENLTDEEFEFHPGTPGPRRSWRVSLERQF